MLKNRIDEIDIIKGIGILFVLYGHSFIDSKGPVKIWLYTFHLSLFFFCAGYTFEPDKYRCFRALLTRKSKTVLFPYFLYSFLCFFFTLMVKFALYIKNGVFSWREAGDSFIGIFLQIRDSRFEGFCWFILLIFLLNIYLFFLYRTANGSIKKMAVYAAILYIIACFYEQKVGIKLPWHGDAVLIAGVFSCIGFIYRKRNYTFDNRFMFFIMAGLSVFVLVYDMEISGMRPDLFEGVIGNPIVFFLGNVSGVYLTGYFAYKNKRQCIKTILIYIGKNSMIFYALHQAVLYSFLKPLLYKLYLVMLTAKVDSNLATGFISILLVTVTTLAISVFAEVKKRIFL